MKILTFAFLEKDGSFSWRKGLTCICAFIFAFANISYLFGLSVLPSPYIYIITGVFAFYFFKKRVEKISNKLNNND